MSTPWWAQFDEAGYKIGDDAPRRGAAPRQGVPNPHPHPLPVRENDEQMFRDIYLAAYMLASGVRLVRVRPKERAVNEFVFVDQNGDLRACMQQWRDETAQVNMHGFLTALKRLKNIAADGQPYEAPSTEGSLRNGQQHQSAA